MSIPTITPKSLNLSSPTLPQSTSQKDTTQKQQQLSFNTDKYGELVVTGIGQADYASNKAYSIPISTNQGDFVFIADDFVQKGHVADIDIPGGIEETRQYYSKAFIGDNRNDIFNSAVGVDLSAIPEKTTGSKGREFLYGIEGGDNRDLSKLISKKGILVPSDVAEQIEVSFYEITDEKGKITGLVDTSDNPYLDDNFVYAREGNETAPRGSVDLRYINSEGETGYTYSWQESGGWLSEKLGEVVDFADDLIQNPFARLGVSIFYPAVGTVLNSYAKLDSGEELSGADIAGLVTAGSNLADINISDAAAKSLEVGAKLADGASIESVVVDEIASGALEDTEIGKSIKNSVEDAVGSDVVDFVENNEATIKTVVDVSQGKDLSESIVDNFGDTIVDATGAETTNEIAAVKGGLDAAVQLDQGADKDEAALAGVSKYIDEGGTIPSGDVDVDGFSLSGLGIDLGNFPDFVGDIDAKFETIPDVAISLFEGGLSIPEIEGLGIDISGVEFPEADLGMDTDLSLGDVDLGIDEVDVSLGDADIDLPEVSVNTPEVELGDADLGIEGPDLPEVDGPDISIPTLDLMEFAGLLGGLSTTGGGRATTEEQPESQYQTQFDFLAGLQPLGMFGTFQRRS